MSREILQNPSDPEEESIVVEDRLADRIFRSEIFAGHVPRRPDRERFLKRVCRLAGQDRVAEDLQEIGIGEQDVRLLENLVAAPENPAPIDHPGGKFHIGEFRFHGLAEGGRRNRPPIGAHVDIPRLFGDDPVDVLRPLVKIVIAEFIADIKERQEAEGQTDGQAEEVDKSIEFELGHRPQGDFHDVFEHIDSDLDGIQNIGSQSEKHLAPIPKSGPGAPQGPRPLDELFGQVALDGEFLVVARQPGQKPSGEPRGLGRRG